MSSLLRDLRFGAHSLKTSPTFTAVAVLTLALGVGSNAAIYSTVSGLILDPLPWDNAGELVAISEWNKSQDVERRGASTAKYREWVEQAQSFRGLAAAAFASFNLTDGDQNLVADGFRVTPNALLVAGIRPPLGRSFVPEDAAPDAPPVVLLTHTLWESRYGSDPNIVGRNLEINGEPATVIGVMGPLQWLPTPWSNMLAPLRLEQAELSRTDHTLNVYGWLEDGVSIEQAQSEMSLIALRLEESYPETDAGWRIRVEDARTIVVQGSNRAGVWLWMGLAGFVLLIACANVANLQLARGAARQKEIAIRSALGASRGRIVQQLLTESALLAAIALPLALLVTRWVLDYFLSFTPGRYAYMPVMLRLDAPVFVFAFGASLLTVVLFGLAPALNASRSDLSVSLKEGGERGSSSGGGPRLRSALVVFQIALSLSLLVCSALFVERFGLLMQTDAGFRIENLLTTSVNLPLQRYPEPEHWRLFQRDLLGRLDTLPGVRSAATATWTPFGFGGDGRDFRIQGRATGGQDELPSASWSNVGLSYFETLDVRLAEGRSFEETDGENAVPVVIVNEALVQRYFAGESPIGQQLLFEHDETPREIVGVVTDSAQYSFTEPVFPQLYEPFAQQPGPVLNLLLRTEGSPLAIGGAVRAAARELDPLLPLYEMESMTMRTRDTLWPQRLSATVVGIVSAIALTLALVGVYGVVSYSTSQRTAEFGIRAALGADPTRIAWLVLRQAAVLAAWGLPIGLLLAWWMTRALSALLPGMPGFQPLSFVAVGLLLALAALLASAVPAVRATERTR